MNQSLPTEPAGADRSTGVAPSEEAHVEAISQLFVAHNRALHSFLLARLGGNEQEAHDVAQEAYVRLLQLDRPEAVSLLRAYLFRTAANLAVDRMRQRVLRARLDQAGADPEVAADTLTPDRCLLASEELQTLEQALQELPPRYRRAFLLHRFDDWPTRRIAEEFGIQERMVRNYISRTTLYCQLRMRGMAPRDAKQQVMP